MGNTAQRSDIEPAVVLLVLKLSCVGPVNLDILRMKRLQIPQFREALAIMVESNAMSVLPYGNTELLDQSQMLDGGKLREFEANVESFRGNGLQE